MEEEVGASQEEDGTIIRDLQYWEVVCELSVSNLLDFDGKSVKRGVGIERDNCSGLRWVTLQVTIR